MGNSPLDLVNSEAFRKKLITRNLTPYIKAPNRPTPPTNYEYIQSDTSVQDSPDQLIDEPSFANQLYPLNQYGNDGGYQQVPDPGGLLNTKSNEGQYGFQDAHLIDEGYAAIQDYRPLNAFADTTRVFDSAESFSSLDVVYPDGGRIPNAQPYPAGLVNSSYSSVSILLSDDPQGSNGLLSQDSFIARLGAKTLKKDFLNRIATQIRRDTLGRVNAFNVRSGTDVLNMVTGRVPLIEPNYTITVPSNPIIAATDFALRLAGSTIPVSPIPGSYWDTSINPGQPTTIQQLNNAFKKTATGKFFTRLLGGDKTGSQIMYNNLGGGQKSRLFANIDYNRFKPSYDRTLFDRLGGALVSSTTNNSDYYVGSKTSDPSRVFSPGGDLPVNSYGQEQQSPVYGPQELAQLYEGPSKDVRLGANGPAYSDGGGIEGGFTWVSPKYKGNAGKKVGVGGEISDQDQNFRPSSYNSTESTNRTFRDGSILDDTQRIIESQPQGGRRLQHVGNAIDQVSKVFNDGYKEITKGSRVLSYVGSLGQEVGTEYCRVFAKDVPYLQYNDLQKQDGITTEGRRFSYSVLDKTYNLNIAPNKQEGGQDSSNLIGSDNNAYAKKYMFSIENLAWRTSATAGYSVSDLAICERGPNGGRVMWFPPYGLTFTENTSASWKGNDFIGRPEPIYTYNNTSRSGSLTWKIVVDHPSVLNLVVNRVLNNETNKARIDSILESFFAGCKKYDLYELAKKYYTINPNDLFQIQQAITSKEMSYDQMEYTLKSLNSGKDGTSSTGGAGQPTTQSTQTTVKDFDKYNNYGFYFDNDIPKKNSSVGSFSQYYDQYASPSTKNSYLKLAPTVSQPYNSTPDSVGNFFGNIIEYNFTALNQMVTEMVTFLNNNPDATIAITLQGSASAPAKKDYNIKLSERRNDSVVKWFQSNSGIADAIKAGRFTFKDNVALGESPNVQTTGKNGNGESYECSSAKDSLNAGEHQIYTVNAMACRRVSIKVDVKNVTKTQKPAEVTPQQDGEFVGQIVPKTKLVPQIETKVIQKDNITKKVLRALLSECDYFETIKDVSPMVYDNLKDKLKFFQPAFHSTTPEGLNTRLTFLQQCMRPGDTIPTIKTVNGKSTTEYNNAVNTAFGAPPVLILRVGDFYNTKIIPEGLQLSYENLDINPEGIGIQPMIANVTLSFKFVGGSGLKESVDKLQNALTFNYYANTEIYDDRADATDESYKVIDKDFLNAIGAIAPVPTVNQTQNNNGQNNNSTIGTIKTTVTSTSGTTTGVISYKEFMDKFVAGTQTYFTNIFNKELEVFTQYNNAMMQKWTANRNYILGNLLVDKATQTKTTVFGKPAKLESSINKVFDDLIDDIDSKKTQTEDDFIKYISNKSLGFDGRVISQLRTNYINYVKNKKGSYQNTVTRIIQETTVSMQNYIQFLSRANVLPYNSVSNKGTDGLQQPNGFVVAYDISGTTKVGPANTGGPTPTNTLEELKYDIQRINLNVNDFYKIVTKSNNFNYGPSSYNGILLSGAIGEGREQKDLDQVVFVPFTNNVDNGPFTSFPFRREYMILSMDVLDDVKYSSFKDAMIGSIIKNKGLFGNGNTDLSGEFDKYWKGVAKPAFEKENNVTKTFMDNLKDGKLKNYLNYTPFSSKDREFTYEIVSNTATTYPNQKILISSLNTNSQGKQQGSNLTEWNVEQTGDVYISKTKLN